MLPTLSGHATLPHNRSGYDLDQQQECGSGVGTALQSLSLYRVDPHFTHPSEYSHLCKVPHRAGLFNPQVLGKIPFLCDHANVFIWLYSWHL